ncbi:MAG: PEP-CTERM sorting domain-containing protein [Nitrospiraceae bacterium]
MKSNTLMKNVWLVSVGVISLLWITSGNAEATVVSQLNITGGSVAFKLDGLPFSPPVNFTAPGTLLMGQYQPPSNIFAPIAAGPYTFQITTQANPGGLPTPTGSVTGSTMTVDLQSMFASITGPGLGIGGISLNIGNQPPLMATGTFNPVTEDFNISWDHLYGSSHPGHPWAGLRLTLLGNADLVPVPLPASILLFGTGLVGVVLSKLRRIV